MIIEAEIVPVMSFCEETTTMVPHFFIISVLNSCGYKKNIF